MTLKTHDLAHEFGAAGGVIQAGSTKAMRRLVEYFIQFYRDNLYNSHWGGSVSINGNRLEIAMYCLDVTERELRWTWLLFSDLIRNCDQDYTVVEEIRAGCRSARSWWDFAAHRESGVQGVAVDDRPGARGTDGWWEADREQVGAFVIGCDSVWLSEHLLTDKILLAEKLVASAAIFRVDLHFGMGLGGGSCAARTGSRNTATNPAMLNAFALAVVGKSGKPRYPGFDQRPGWSAEGVEDAQRIREAMDVLRQIAPNGGSYISLSDYYNDDWVLKYWGSNAGRLSQIKAMYDPDDLFSVHHGIIGQRSHEA
jgi:hypothetical protein